MRRLHSTLSFAILLYVGAAYLGCSAVKYLQAKCSRLSLIDRTNRVTATLLAKPPLWVAAAADLRAYGDLRIPVSGDRL